MPSVTSAIPPMDGKRLPSLTLLLILTYAVVSIVMGASIRQFETEARLSIERSYAAATLDKELGSLMRDAQAMISAPTQLRMQDLLINLEEYEAGLDAMSFHARARSDLNSPIGALEDALPVIRRLSLEAARLDTDRSASAVQNQALELTRLDTQMRAQITLINDTLAAAPSSSTLMVNGLRAAYWIINGLALIALLGLIYGAVRSTRPGLENAHLSN